jgi:hypothetical protein
VDLGLTSVDCFDSKLGILGSRESDFQSAKIRKSAKDINKQNAVVTNKQPEKESEAPPAAPLAPGGRRTRARR